MDEVVGLAVFRLAMGVSGEIMNSDPSIEATTIPGGWRDDRLVIEGREFRLLRPAAPDDFLEHLPDDWDAIRGAADPYWAHLWPASLALATLVLREPWTNVSRAMELGAGIGLVGLAALARGWEVTFSDHAPLSVAVCAENARRNGFSQACSVCLDWKSPPDDRFPLILASDILYERENHPLLWRLFDRMLTDDGIGWIGDPGRYYAGEFLAGAIQAGFSCQLFDSERRPIHTPVAGEFFLATIRRRA